MSILRITGCLLLMAALSIPANAQVVENVWTDLLPSGATLPQIYKNAAKDRLKVDFDGDSDPEISSIIEDENGNTTAINIYDPPAREPVYSLLQFEIQLITEPARLRVVGLLNGGTDDASLVMLKRVGTLNPDTILVMSLNKDNFVSSLTTFPSRDGAGKRSASEIETLTDFTLLDFDGDEVPELVVQDTTTGVIEVWTTSSTVNVSTEEPAGLLQMALRTAYPNPATGPVTIPYTIDTASPVSLKVYDMLGRQVHTLFEGDQSAGRYQANWDGTDASGKRVAAGMYVYQLRVGDQSESRTMIRIE